MAYVYILQSQKTGIFYIGSTDNLEERLMRHFSGQVPYTRPYLPLVLRLSQEYPTLSFAKKMEYRLKRFKRRDFIEKIVKDGNIKISVK